MLRLAWLQVLRMRSSPVPLATLAFAIAVAFLPATPLAREAPAGALEREATWTGALLVLGPGSLLLFAGVLARWRRGEADWLGSRPIGRTAALVATWFGIASGVLAVCAAVVLVTERPWQAPSDARATRLAGSVELPSVVRLEAGEVWSTEVETGGLARGRLRVRVMPIAGGAPTTDARLCVKAGATRAIAEERVSARTWLEATVPSSHGSVLVTLENTGDGDLALLADAGIELWEPGGSAALGSLAIGLRALLALVALGALALGLGAWVSTPFAATLVGSLWVGAVARGAWFPGADLPRALAIVGEGRLPGWPPPSALLGALGVAALGIGLARLGLRSWRHAG